MNPTPSWMAAAPPSKNPLDARDRRHRRGPKRRHHAGHDTLERIGVAEDPPYISVTAVPLERAQ